MNARVVLSIIILFGQYNFAIGQISLFSKTVGDTLLEAVLDTSIYRGVVYSIEIGPKKEILYFCQTTDKVVDMAVRDSIVGIIELDFGGYYVRNTCKLLPDTVEINTKFADCFLGFTHSRADEHKSVYTHVSMPDPYHIYCKYDAENYLITFDLEGNKTVTKL